MVSETEEDVTDRSTETEEPELMWVQVQPAPVRQNTEEKVLGKELETVWDDVNG